MKSKTRKLIIGTIICTLFTTIIPTISLSAKSHSFSNKYGDATYCVGSKEKVGTATSSVSAYKTSYDVCASVRETVYYYTAKGSLKYHDVDQKTSSSRGVTYVSVSYTIPKNCKRIHYTSSHHSASAYGEGIKTYNMSSYYNP